MDFSSDLVEIRDIANAGKGLVATRTIVAGTVALVSRDLAVHLIFREYQKEVCAYCFYYDRGRALPIRDNESGKVWCSTDCQSKWTEEQGDIGLESWKLLETYMKKKNKANTILSDGLKPTLQEIDQRWKQTEDRVERFKHSSTDEIRERHRKALLSSGAQPDPDILSYLLSGVLLHHQRPTEWQRHLLKLALDRRPYKDNTELNAYCSGYMQLVGILPHELLKSVTAGVCRTVVDAASHNAFGIRSGSDDNEEYMGYSVFPSASFFNHSCSPNIEKKRVRRTWEFRAVERILPGQQCCITYLGGEERDMSVLERRSRLRDVWGFLCECSRCIGE